MERITGLRSYLSVLLVRLDLIPDGALFYPSLLYVYCGSCVTASHVPVALVLGDYYPHSDLSLQLRLPVYFSSLHVLFKQSSLSCYYYEEKIWYSPPQKLQNFYTLHGHI